MCFLCQQDNPFDLIRFEGIWGALEGEIGKIKAEIKETKKQLKLIEDNEDTLCSDGDTIQEKLVEKQYELARLL